MSRKLAKGKSRRDIETALSIMADALAALMMNNAELVRQLATFSHLTEEQGAILTGWMEVNVRIAEAAQLRTVAMHRPAGPTN